MKPQAQLVWQALNPTIRAQGYVGALPGDQQDSIAGSPDFVGESHSPTPTSIQAGQDHYFFVVTRGVVVARRDLRHSQRNPLGFHPGIGVADATGEGASPLLEPGDVRRMVYDPHAICLMVPDTKPGLDHELTFCGGAKGGRFGHR